MESQETHPGATTPASLPELREHLVFSQPSQILWVERKRLLNMREYGLADYENSEIKMKIPFETTLPVSNEFIRKAISSVDAVISEWESSELKRIQESNDAFHEQSKKARREESVKYKWKQIMEGLKPREDPLPDRVVDYVKRGVEADAQEICEEFSEEFGEEAVLGAIIGLVTGWKPRLEEIHPGLFRLVADDNLEDEGE